MRQGKVIGMKDIDEDNGMPGVTRRDAAKGSRRECYWGEVCLDKRETREAAPTAEIDQRWWRKRETLLIATAALHHTPTDASTGQSMCLVDNPQKRAGAWIHTWFPAISDENPLGVNEARVDADHHPTPCGQIRRHMHYAR